MEKIEQKYFFFSSFYIEKMNIDQQESLMGKTGREYFFFSSF